MTHPAHDDFLDAQRHLFISIHLARDLFHRVAKRWIYVYAFTQEVYLINLLFLAVSPWAPMPSRTAGVSFTCAALFFIVHLFARGRLALIAHNLGGVLRPGFMYVTLDYHPE